jgi:hypothetical protein
MSQSVVVVVVVVVVVRTRVQGARAASPNKGKYNRVSPVGVY